MEGKKLSDLAASDMSMKHHYGMKQYNMYGNGCWGWGRSWANLFVWFVIIAVIIWLILYSVKPDFVKKTAPDGSVTDEVDNGKALIWSIVIAIIIVVLIRLFMYSGW